VRERKRNTQGQSDTLRAVAITVLASGLFTGILIIQNTRPARLEFLFWSVTLPLAAVLLLAALAGAILGVSFSYIRQRQLRRSARARLEPNGAETEK
jgi:uncharacterized integral membrane protein